jgi:hypothetical protein
MLASQGFKERAMQISDLALRLLLLFFPGIICAYVVDTLTVHRPRQPFFFVLQSFVLGLSSYFLYFIFCWLLNTFWTNRFCIQVSNLSALIDSKAAISFREVCFVTVAALFLAVTISVSQKHKLVFRMAHLLRVTGKFGELDVWGYTMNLREVEWVTVRDHAKDLMYDGWIQAFSDDSKNAELLLRDVSVYKNISGERLYQIGALYISRNRDDITIECRTIPVDDNRRWKEKENASN